MIISYFVILNRYKLRLSPYYSYSHPVGLEPTASGFGNLRSTNWTKGVGLKDCKGGGENKGSINPCQATAPISRIAPNPSGREVCPRFGWYGWGQTHGGAVDPTSVKPKSFLSYTEGMETIEVA